MGLEEGGGKQVEWAGVRGNERTAFISQGITVCQTGDAHGAGDAGSGCTADGSRQRGKRKQQ